MKRYGRGVSTLFFLIMLAVSLAPTAIGHDPGTFFFTVAYAATAYWGVAMLVNWLR